MQIYMGNYAIFKKIIVKMPFFRGENSNYSYAARKIFRVTKNAQPTSAWLLAYAPLACSSSCVDSLHSRSITLHTALRILPTACCAYLGDPR